MGAALDRLRVALARTFVARHKRVTAEGTVEDVESHWRELPASVRKTFKESMHAPSVQGGQSHPFDAPDARPLKTLSPGERAVYEAVQQNVGRRKAEQLKAKVAAGGGNPYVRKPGYLKSGRGSTAAMYEGLGPGEPGPIEKAIREAHGIAPAGPIERATRARLGMGFEQKPGTTTCAVCGQTLHPSLKKGQWAHSKKADHAPQPVSPK